MTAASDYDVFMSYSRDQADRDIVVRLQDQLQQFARPWFRPGVRTLRVYRDQTNLPPSPDLWGTLEGAMSSSRCLVLVASPRSAKSQWVRRELDWWREQRGSASIRIAVADGELRWDEAGNDFDWTVTTAVSRAALGKAFEREPSWVDLRSVARTDDGRRRAPLARLMRSAADPRLQDAAASLIAEVKGVPKDALIGEHLLRSRQTRRVVASTLLALVLLLAASVTAGVVARSQRDRAVQEATVSEAGQLAAISQSLTGSNLDLAELFAAQAYRLSPDAQTRAALFNAVTADPHLVRYLPATGTVSALATSSDGSTAVAGTAGGAVLRWSLADYRRALVGSLPGSVAGVAASADGGTIAAENGSAAMIWVQGKGATLAPVPDKWAIFAIAVSPSGQYVALSAQAPDSDINAIDPNNYIIVVDERTGRSVITKFGTATSPAQNLSFDGANRLVGLNNYGQWERFTVPGLSKVIASSASFAPNDNLTAISATGEFISTTNGESPTPVWSTLTASNPAAAPPFGAEVSGVAPDALAISADGTRVADADNGTVYVSDVTDFSAVYGYGGGTPLTGNATINQQDLTFIGQSKSALLSASGSLLSVWNLNQYSRIATHAYADIPAGCNACTAPGIYPSPDGDSAIITAALAGPAAQQAMLISLPPAAGHMQILSPGGSANVTYGPALWSPDSQEFSILTPSDGGGEVWSAAGKPEFLRAWKTTAKTPAGPDGGPGAPVSAVLAAGGKEIVEVDTAGKVIIRDAATGAVEREVAGTVSPDDGDQNLPYMTAVDADAKYAAFVVNNQTSSLSGSYVDVVNIGTGAITRLPGGTASGVAYDGELLIIQRADGTLEVRSADGQRLIRSLAGAVNAVSGPAVNDAGFVVELNSDGTAPVFDIASGQEIGTIALPVIPPTLSTTIAFTPDGRNLISVTDAPDEAPGTGQVTDWSFAPSLWSEVACSSAGHALTADEWQQYIGTGGPGMPNQLACQS
jgi:WD40 repeat protein